MSYEEKYKHIILPLYGKTRDKQQTKNSQKGCI